MISPDIHAEIRRLFFAEHYSFNSISETLGVHFETVRRAVDLGARQHMPRALRDGMLTPYLPIVEEYLTKTPRLCSSRLIQILEARGYRGSIRQLRRAVAILRPKKQRAYASLTFFPAEQAQVDWASFGTMAVGRAERKLSCFVMTLSYSRAIFAAFTFDQSLESFLRCHIAAFKYLGGAARILLYDNLKSAVIDRQGQAIRFNSIFLEMAGHYCFQPRACNVRSGWEKGRVERTVRYIRDNFFAARCFKDLADANDQLLDWLNDICNLRPWPEDRSKTVGEQWGGEKPRLLNLAKFDFPTDEVGPCRSNKLCYIRFDCNDYSVPHSYVSRLLTLIASDKLIRICDGKIEIACHQRSYSKGEKIKDEAHFIGLFAHKPAAAATTYRARLIALIPEAEAFYELMIDSGLATGNQTTKLFKLLEIYGVEPLREAIIMATAKGHPRATYVAQILAKMGRCNNPKPPSLPIVLPDRRGLAEFSVSPHALAQYDALTPPPENPNEGDHNDD